MSARRRIKEVREGAAQLVRRHRPDYQIILFMGILILLGIVVLYAISPARVELINASDGGSLDQIHFIQRQFFYVFLGLVAFAVAAILPVSFWKKYASKILIGALGACLLLAILGLVGAPLALCTLGACSWFNFGFVTFQPAELLKFGLLLFVAVFLGRRMSQGKVNDAQETILPLAIVVGISLFFVVVMQRDLGTGISLMGIIAAMLFIAGINKRFGLMAAGIVLVLAMLMVVVAPHRMERMTAFLNPSETEDVNYHINQAKIAIGSGGLFGVGLGNGVSAFGYVPEAVNDSIFAVMGELFGFIGLVALIALFVALLLRILNIMDTIHDPPMKLIVAGVFGWIGVQVVVNIGAMIGVLPLTGVTLPLLSFGGSSLLFIMMGLGLVFQISRYTSHRAKDKGGSDEDSRSWRRFGRPRHTSRRRI